MNFQHSILKANTSSISSLIKYSGEFPIQYIGSQYIKHLSIAIKYSSELSIQYIGSQHINHFFIDIKCSGEFSMKANTPSICPLISNTVASFQYSILEANTCNSSLISNTVVNFQYSILEVNTSSIKYSGELPTQYIESQYIKHFFIDQIQWRVSNTVYWKPIHQAFIHCYQI